MNAKVWTKTRNGNLVKRTQFGAYLVFFSDYTNKFSIVTPEQLVEGKFDTIRQAQNYVNRIITNRKIDTFLAK